MRRTCALWVLCAACRGGPVADDPGPGPVVAQPATPVAVAGSSDGGAELVVPIAVRARWLPVSPTAAVLVRQAVHPDTRAPYDATLPDVSRLTHEFRLKPTRFFVGEPILVELHLEWSGPGSWTEPIGGNYRGRGRDDNFAFLLRGPDGQWVDDPLGRETMIGGGIATSYEISPDQPRSHWLAVARYAALTRPGHYDLYCIEYAHGYETIGWQVALEDAIPDQLADRYTLAPSTAELIDRATGERSGRQLSVRTEAEPQPASPVVAALPAAVREQLPDYLAPAVATYAHFEIDVAEPTAAERRAMVATWSAIADVRPESSTPPTRAEAAREAAWFSATEDFLPLVRHWIGNRDLALPQYLTGLAVNRSPAAAKLLLEVEGEYPIAAMYWLREEHRAVVAPTLIDRLTSADDGVRGFAFQWLSTWVDNRFDVPWTGYLRGRPTVEEGRALAPKFRAAWADRR